MSVPINDRDSENVSKQSKVGDQIRESLDAKLILNTVKVLGSIPSVELVGNDA